MPVRRTSTKFGWQDLHGTEFWIPSGRIDARGFHPINENSDFRIDLSECPWATSLDLRQPDPAQRQDLKQHIAQQFLGCHSLSVTLPLLGSVVAALLSPFAPGFNRFALWLVGLTGSGKSFAAGLTQHYFGDFGGLCSGSGSGRIQTWASTGNQIPQVGYYAKDAIYLVDDYKPNALGEMQRQFDKQVLQNYADGTARGRLNSDCSFKDIRPIRGFLIATGEDLPEHSASTTVWRSDP